jgi:hypothetical protein
MQTEKTEYRKLKFFQGKATYKNVKQSVKINPDIDYWKDIFGLLEEYELNDPDVQSSPEWVDFLTNNWVTKDLHQAVKRHCEGHGIPIGYVDDLVVPLSHFAIMGRTNVRDDIRDIAREQRKLVELFNLLEDRRKDGSLKNQVASIGFQIVTNVDIDDDLNDTYDKLCTIKIDHLKAVELFMREIQLQVREDTRLRRIVMESPNLPFENFSLRTELPRQKDRIASIIARFLMDKGLAKSFNESVTRTGAMMAIVGYTLSETAFKQDENMIVTYGSYNKYLSEVVGKRIFRWRKKYD